MWKEFLATMMITGSLMNVSAAPVIIPKATQDAPSFDFHPIGIHDTLLSREDVAAIKEARKAEEEAKKAEAEKNARIEAMADGRIMTVLATGYCPCSYCCGKDDGITATGTRATEGRTIAADPRLLPYGTHVLIDGHEYVVEDCGGDIQNHRIDVFFSSHSAANAFGKHYVTLEVLG